VVNRKVLDDFVDESLSHQGRYGITNLVEHLIHRNGCTVIPLKACEGPEPRNDRRRKVLLRRDERAWCRR
jgi:hypothetical protein